MKGREVCLLVVVALLTACANGPGALPDSGGKPFEVLVVDDNDSLVTRSLLVDAEGLPQSEPSFDVSRVASSQWKGSLKLARAIVVRDTSRTMRQEVDRYARPQLIVYTDGRDGKRLLALLREFELRVATEWLRQRHNAKTEETIRQMFGVSVLIPSDMNSAKRGEDFLWLSDNKASAMRNVCIYKGVNRDSVMRQNVKGETDSMYMQTVKGMVKERPLPDGGVYRYGLWEMKGDAMGGPFASVTRQGVTVEAFVYAPGGKKRNLMRQLDAVLYSLRTQ